MADDDMARRLVEAVVSDFPDHKPYTRPAHTVGIGVRGYFQPTPIARLWCIAKHFEGPKVRATVRFSNSSGSPDPHDGWSDARGMAVRFHISDDEATDLVSMTLREFFSPTPEAFLDFAAAAVPKDVEKPNPWAKIGDFLRLMPPLPDPYPGQTYSSVAGSMRYASSHAASQLAAFDASLLGAPVSYARATYNAVHTFRITAPDKTQRYVRFFWQPVAGVEMVDPKADPVDEYLQDELRDRIGTWPVEFILLMMVGELGDPLDDPTKAWPLHRIRVNMGSLVLDEVPEDQDTWCEKMSYNPGRLIPGIEMSDDPVLRARKDAYELSAKNRRANLCPFHQGQG